MSAHGGKFKTKINNFSFEFNLKISKKMVKDCFSSLFVDSFESSVPMIQFFLTEFISVFQRFFVFFELPRNFCIHRISRNFGYHIEMEPNMLNAQCLIFCSKLNLLNSSYYQKHKISGDLTAHQTINL